MLAFNDIYRTAAESAGGEFVDIWDGFVDENGAFVDNGPDMNGQPVRLRGADGINLSKAGKRKIAFYAEKPLASCSAANRQRQALAAACADVCSGRSAPTADIARSTAPHRSLISDPGTRRRHRNCSAWRSIAEGAMRASPARSWRSKASRRDALARPRRRFLRRRALSRRPAAVRNDRPRSSREPIV